MLRIYLRQDLLNIMLILYWTMHKCLTKLLSLVYVSERSPVRPAASRTGFVEVQVAILGSETKYKHICNEGHLFR